MKADMEISDRMTPLSVFNIGKEFVLGDSAIFILPYSRKARQMSESQANYLDSLSDSIEKSRDSRMMAERYAVPLKRELWSHTISAGGSKILGELEALISQGERFEDAIIREREYRTKQIEESCRAESGFVVTQAYFVPNIDYTKDDLVMMGIYVPANKIKQVKGNRSNKTLEAQVRGYLDTLAMTKGDLAEDENSVSVVLAENPKDRSVERAMLNCLEVYARAFVKTNKAYLNNLVEQAKDGQKKNYNPLTIAGLRRRWNNQSQSLFNCSHRYLVESYAQVGSPLPWQKIISLAADQIKGTD